MSEAGPAIRLDKWLWQARFFKTRGLAAKCIAEGQVRVNAVRVIKPSTSVRIGYALTFAQGSSVRVFRVVALGMRRGPATEAQTLYEELGKPADPAP